MVLNLPEYFTVISRETEAQGIFSIVVSFMALLSFSTVISSMTSLLAALQKLKNDPQRQREMILLYFFIGVDVQPQLALKKKRDNMFMAKLTKLCDGSPYCTSILRKPNVTGNQKWIDALFASPVQESDADDHKKKTWWFANRIRLW